MDFRLFFRNKFLRTTFGNFAESLNDADYSKFKGTLKTNRSWYIPAGLFEAEDKTIQKLFDSIDGSIMSNDDKKFSRGEKNSKLEEKELYDWVKYNYKTFTGKEITDEELKNMKMSEFMSEVEDFLNNGFEL